MLHSHTFCFALVALSLYGDAKGQIVGGTAAELGTFNFLVKLDVFYAVENNENYVPEYQTCGGTIIAWNWILTAAHCFFDVETKVGRRRVKAKWKKLKVTAGVKHVNDSNGQVQSVEDNDGRVWLHPDQKGHRKDVALIRLKQTLNRSRTVGTAWFLKTPMDYDFEKKIRERGGVDCIVQGWGNTHIMYSRTLKKLEYRLDPQHAKEGKIPLYQYRDGLFVITNGRGKCPKAAPGDSGAPVVCVPAKRVERDGCATYERQDEHGLVYAVLSGGDCFGVTTADASCVDPGYAVWTFAWSGGWIRSTMWQLECYVIKYGM